MKLLKNEHFGDRSTKVTIYGKHKEGFVKFKIKRDEVRQFIFFMPYLKIIIKKKKMGKQKVVLFKLTTIVGWWQAIM